LARVKRGVTTHARHKKVLALAKGYRGRGSTAYRVAIEKVEKALRYAYRDRRNRKHGQRNYDYLLLCHSRVLLKFWSQPRA